MFFDWLTIYQDHEFQSGNMPQLSRYNMVCWDTVDDDVTYIQQKPIQHEGSFDSRILIRINGNRVSVSGNPSRFNRLDNLFGLSSLDECVQVYNDILQKLGLPLFTKCTFVDYYKKQKTDETLESFSDGAVIQEVHVTKNISVGQDKEQDYIKGLSTQKIGHSNPHLLPDQNTIHWLTSNNKAPLVYRSVYNKGFEIERKLFKKVIRKYGEKSNEKIKVQRVLNYCKREGVVRLESKIKSRHLRRYGLQYYGITTEQQLFDEHQKLVDIDKKLTVNAMNIETISEQLINQHIVDSTKAANTTAMYAFQWMHGQVLNLGKSQVKIHRARLRQIGIDIGLPCDLMKHSMVHVKEVVEIEVKDTPIPHWYSFKQTEHVVH